MLRCDPDLRMVDSDRQREQPEKRRTITPNVGNANVRFIVVRVQMSSTFRLTDAGPMTPDCQQRRDPGVRCSRWFDKAFHMCWYTTRTRQPRIDSNRPRCSSDSFPMFGFIARTPECAKPCGHSYTKSCNVFSAPQHGMARRVKVNPASLTSLFIQSFQRPTSNTLPQPGQVILPKFAPQSINSRASFLQVLILSGRGAMLRKYVTAASRLSASGTVPGSSGMIWT